LWDCLADIIPFYQRNFGVDGARIDMGHALPDALTSMIMSKAKALDPSFTFIAEELSTKRATVAKKQGYNCIIGDGFSELSRVLDYRFSRFVYSAKDVALPLFACGETHDSPRLASRYGQEKLTELVALFSYFIPNTIPFINSGQELYEPQPMNTGLDCQPNEKFRLSHDDPYYGKLALFDRYQFHYGANRQRLISLLQQVNVIRQQYLPAITSKKSWIDLKFSSPFDLVAGFAYKYHKKHLLVVVNLNLEVDCMHYLNLTEIETEHLLDNFHQIFTNGKNQDLDYQIVDKWVNIHFEPGEVKIFEITK
jgi:starch synthase (maltosyl-transferring)